MSKDGSKSHRTEGDEAGDGRPAAEPGAVGMRDDPGEAAGTEVCPLAEGSSAGEMPEPDADSRGPAASDEVPADEDSVADATGAKAGKGAVRRAAKAVAESAKRAPAVIAKDALVVAAASQPYLKAAIEKQRAVAGGGESAEGAGQTPAADLPTGTPGPLGVLAAGVAEALVEKAVGLVAGRDAAHKAGVAAAKAVGELADKAAAAAAEKAIRAVAGPADATRSDSAPTVVGPADAVTAVVDPAAETRIAKKATKPRKKAGRGKAEAGAEPEIPSPS